jgi:tetratricopeptide (TPR) repeat protein
MKLPFGPTGISMLALAFGASLALTTASPALQGTDPNKIPDVEQQRETDQQLKQRQLNKDITEQAAPKLDPQEEAAYKSFFDASEQDAAKRIDLGQDFLQKYPASRYAEAVHSGLVRAYYAKQDWPNFFASGDKALALKADDVDILAMVGWVIPHLLDPKDPDAGQKLDKAESFEKRALVALATMTMPAGMTDEQFAKYKTEKSAEAHSGLGLVYFRRSDFEASARELQQATQAVPNPDPTDLYALGASLYNLKRFSEAAGAFTKCAESPNGLQAVCKQQAEDAKKHAAQPK